MHPPCSFLLSGLHRPPSVASLGCWGLVLEMSGKLCVQSSLPTRCTNPSPFWEIF